jgi:hypothetical protein
VAPRTSPRSPSRLGFPQGGVDDDARIIGPYFSHARIAGQGDAREKLTASKETTTWQQAAATGKVEWP